LSGDACPLRVPFYDIGYPEKLHVSISLNPAAKLNFITGGINKMNEIIH
jgi:hypothetical protein